MNLRHDSAALFSELIFEIVLVEFSMTLSNTSHVEQPCVVEHTLDYWCTFRN